MKLHRINALLWKYYYITINRMDRLFDVVYWPILDIILWGLASYFIEDVSGFNPLSMLLGGVILWVFTWRASQDIAVFVLEDFWSKNLYHLFSSPVRISEHTASIVIVGFLRSLFTFFFLSLFAFLLYSFNVYAIPFGFMVLAIIALTLFGWAMGLVVTSLILRYGQRIQVFAWSMAWIVQPFSCVFYPLESLPPWAVAIAKWNPLTYIFENLRSILYQGTADYSQIAMALLANILLVLLAGWYLKVSFERARETGLLARSE